MLSELLAHLIEWGLGNPSNTLLAATVLVVGWHIHSAADVAKWFRFGGMATMLLAAGLLFGVVNANAVTVLIEVIVGFLRPIFNLLTSLL